jgi:hypothetical protein
MDQKHLLNGDALLPRLKPLIAGEKFIVCRECMIDGPAMAQIDNDFWIMRGNFIAETYQGSAEQYKEFVVDEFKKLDSLKDKTQIFLWFEDDLFCQANYWFCITLIKNLTADIELFRVFPRSNNTDPGWTGFGNLDKNDLMFSLEKAVMLDDEDIQMGKSLWTAYAASDFQQLRELAACPSSAFRKLDDVVEAHIARFHREGEGRPQQTLRTIMSEGKKGFPEIFREFHQREGIYGFGDVQIKLMLENLK